MKPTEFKSQVLSITVFSFLSILIYSCDTTVDHEASTIEAPPAQAPDGADMIGKFGDLSADEMPLTYDQQLNRISQEVPGFSGFYIEDEKLILRSVGADTGDEIKDRLMNLPLDEKAPFREEIKNLIASKETVSIEAQYDFASLYGWKNLIVESGLLPKNMTMLDISERRNLVVVGLESIESEYDITEELSRIGVPKDAIVFEEFPAVARFANLQTSIISPTVGGIQIDGNGYCTLGTNFLRLFYDNGSYVWKPVLLTNDHCTWQRSQNLSYPSMGGHWFDQPDFNNPLASRLGREYWNSMSLNSAGINTGNSLCDDGDCYYTDAAIAYYKDEIDVLKGAIANTQSLNTGSVSWNYTSSTYKVTSTSGNIINGSTMLKVGRSTGVTSGQVTSVCADYYGGLVNGNDAFLLCQFRVDRFNSSYEVAKPGDSGSIVFTPSSGNPSNVTFKGLLWGGDLNQQGLWYVASPFDLTFANPGMHGAHSFNYTGQTY